MAPDTFKTVLTAITAALAGPWFLYDTRNLIRLRNGDRTNPVIRDRQFGYVIGILIAAVGIVGCLRFNGVL